MTRFFTDQRVRDTRSLKGGPVRVRGACAFLWCVVPVILSILKLMGQSLGCEETPRECVCACACARLLAVSAKLFKSPTPSISQPIGQSFPAKGAEVQFADCKINARAPLVIRPDPSLTADS